MYEGPFFKLLGLPVVILVAVIRLRAGVAWRTVAIGAALAAWALVAVDMLSSPILIDPASREHAASFVLPGLNLTPFHTVLELVGRPSGYQAVRQIGGNIGVLLPVGLLAPSLFASVRDWRGMAVLALGLGVGVEVLQLLADWTGWFDRVVDIDDAILNALGVMLGYASWRVLSVKRRRSLPATAEQSTE